VNEMNNLKGNNYTVVRSPIRSIGSKARLIQKHRLWEFFPECKAGSKNLPNGKHIAFRKVYVELFCGSAIMFFNLDPAPKYAILNDSNHDIFNFFTVIKDNYDEFYKELTFAYCGTDWIDMYEKKTDPVSRALSFYIKNRFSNIIPTPVEFPKDFDFWKQKLDASRVQIWNLDAFDALDRLNTVKHENDTNATEYQVYEDPPYVGTETFYGKDFDHARLSKLNHDTTHAVILSYNDCDLVRELYRDWNVIELESYSNMKKRRYTELLLSNRPFNRFRKKIRSSSIF